jgi:hypothetical protein
MKPFKTKLLTSVVGVCCLASLPTLSFAQPLEYGSYSYYQSSGWGSDGANTGTSPNQVVNAPLYDQVGTPIYDQAGGPLYNQANGPLYNQASGPLYDQVGAPYRGPIYDHIARQRTWAGSYPNPNADGSSAISYEAGFPFTLGNGYPGHFEVDYIGQ